MCWAGGVRLRLLRLARPTAVATAQRRKHLAALIQAIFDESDGTYGYRRVHAALARQGEGCGPELVRDLMRELGLVAARLVGRGRRPLKPVRGAKRLLT